jgi:G:T-mismatch repair DNA endonuclease (very short patch repair protein)
MTGYRSLDTYIKKYGEEVGKQRYDLCLKRRKDKIRRDQKGRTVINCSTPEEKLASGDAIRCKACGFITSRLQWTHFKNKCSVKTIAEYKTLYPDAPLVAPNLLKMTKMTKENMIAAHGEVDGLVAWEKYKERQAETNTFEYKAAKYGMSREDFREYNASRAVTRSNLIGRHGEEEGLIVWERYVERQRYTMSLEYFIEKYGEIDGLSRFESFCLGRNMGSKFQSKVEIQLFEKLRQKIGPVIDISVRLDNPYLGPYDFGNKDLKNLIEFYGTYWHCDPRSFQPDEMHPQKQMLARHVWARDRAKRTYALNSGYRIFCVWEEDYRRDPTEIVSRIEQWWSNIDESDQSTSCHGGTP